MVMEEAPTPQSVGREFVRQYYTLLNSAPTHLHRFYNHNSLFIHDGLETSHRETKPMIGQKQIHQKIQQLNFRDCHAKITQVDSQATLGNGVVVQVTGELSNGGQPMRRFTQTFVLASQSPKMYYVHNDIFRYQDMGDDDGEHDSGRSETDEDVDPTPQPQSQYYINAQGAQPTHHTVLSAQPQPLQGGSPTPLINPSAVNGSLHLDEHSVLPPQPYLGMPMVPAPTAAPPVPASAPTASPAPTTPAPIALTVPTQQAPSSAAAPVPTQAPTTATVPAPAQAPPVPTLPAASQACAPAEEREAASATEECQEEAGDPSCSQGGAALQAEGEVAEPEVQQNQQPKEDTEAVEEKGQEFEEHQLQEAVPSEPPTYANLLKGSGSGQKPVGRTTASSPPPPQRPENSTSASTTGTSGLSGAGGLSGVGGSRSNSTRPPPRGTMNLRAMSRPSVDRQGPPGRSNNDDSSGDNRRRSSSNQYPDSHQIFVGNVPLSAEDSDLKNIFSQFGPIAEVRLHTNSNKPNNKNRNYAFITFEEVSSVQSVFQSGPINYPGDNGSGGTLNVEKKQPRSRPLQSGSMRGNQSGPPRGGPGGPGGAGGPGGPNGPGGPGSSSRGRLGSYIRGDGAPGGPGGPRNSGGGGGGARSGGSGGGYQNRR